MSKPRIILADTDIDYIIPLQAKLAEEYGDKISLEVVTDRTYFKKLFSKPQKMETLILDEDLYDGALKLHEIGSIFILVERMEEGITDELAVTRLLKYTDIGTIFREILRKSPNIQRAGISKRQGCQSILVFSASGGVGKTTVAAGISSYLEETGENVLYINTDRLQSFQWLLEDQRPMEGHGIYQALLHPSEHLYEELRPVIRKESFSYLPPLKVPLMAAGISPDIFGKIALLAKKSNEYSFIVIDADTTFDEEKARMLDLADKVILVTKQTEAAVCAMNVLAENIDGLDSGKYIFVCNDFRSEEGNTMEAMEGELRFQISEYIEHFQTDGKISIRQLAGSPGIEKVAVLVM